MEKSKPELELRELELKVKELELNVRDLEKPSYKRLSYWTSIISVCIAMIGIIGQSYLSNIKNENANLKTEQAKKEMQEAIVTKQNIKREIAGLTNSIITLNKRKDKIKESLNTMLIAYNKIVYNRAYLTDFDNNKTSASNTSAIINENNNKISKVLLENSIEILLKSSKLKIYYLTSTKQKAIEIDSILKLKGVQSTYEVPNYDLSKGHNEIVYYNKPQMNYCKAV